MCRWFAYISPTEPCLLEDVLITPAHSLTKQVHDHYLPGLVAHHPRDISKEHLITARNVLNNIDGTGIAWYTSDHADFSLPSTSASEDAAPTLRPALYKTTQPPLHDLNFRSICANTSTRVLMAHIRAASGTAITPVNNHPFAFGLHTFMHNGVVSSFSAIKLPLCQKISEPAYAAIQGASDSEHLAALYISFLTNYAPSASAFERTYSAEQMSSALIATVSAVLDLQHSKLGPRARPNSLNLCVSDGSNIVACRFRNHSTQQPPSLYYSTTAGTTLNRKYPDHPDGKDFPERFEGLNVEAHGRHVVIASEPSTYKESDWTLVGRNSVVIARRGVDGVEVRKIPCRAEWDAEDPDAEA